MNNSGKIVVVTGGVFGIGRLISEAFVKTGGTVIIGDIEVKSGKDYAAKLNEELGAAKFLYVDVSSEKSVKTFIRKIKESYGRIDVLINNAGIGVWNDIKRTSLAEWHKVINTNLTGPFMLVKYALPLMSEGSSVVNISSTRAIMSEADTESYSASKGGILALTHALSISLAPRKIRVNAISPGWIDVSGYGKAGAKGQIKIKTSDKLLHPAGRVGKAEDIAESCLFLSDNNKAGFITGQNFVVDGGMTKKMIYD